MADLGLRLSEGIQELKLDQQLAPAREAVVRTLASGSITFFKAVEGVRDRWTQQRQLSTSSSTISAASDARSSMPIEVSKSDLHGHTESPKPASRSLSLLASFTSAINATSRQDAAKRESSTSGTAASLNDVSTVADAAVANNVPTWGSGIGSFFSSKLARTRSNDLPATQASLTLASTEKPLAHVTPVESLLPLSVSPSATPAQSHATSIVMAEGDPMPSEPEGFAVPGLVDLDVRRSLESQHQMKKMEKDAYENEKEGLGVAL